MKIEDLYGIYKQYPNVNTDTRSISNGQLFFALKGANFNGNTYAEEALKKGAAYAIIDEAAHKVNDQCILVEDVLKTLQQLANFHRSQLSIPFLGITGSNGKTTTKELINAVLSTKFKTLATKGNLNNHIGVPLTVLSIDESIEFAIIEMGANKPGDIKELSEIADPDFGIITNIGKAHLEGFGGLEGVIKTKSELYDHIRAKSGTIFINATNSILEKTSQEIKDKIEYQGKDYQGQLINEPGFLKLKNETGEIIETHLVGSYNFENVIAALCIGKYFGVDPSEAAKAIRNYSPTNNRSQLIKGKTNTIIMDAYNANPSSMTAALSNFKESPYPTKIVILGDMLELGKDSGTEHQNIVQIAQSEAFSEAYFVGQEFLKWKNNEHFFESKDTLIEVIKAKPINNAAILIKGSRGIKLEELSEYLS